MLCAAALLYSVNCCVFVISKIVFLCPLCSALAVTVCSALCSLSAGGEEGLGFSWFQSSTDVSGLVLRGAHRWGYVFSHVGGQRLLFRDSRQRFFVLLDHYMCYFDSHAPEVW